MNKPTSEDYQTALQALAPNSGVSDEDRTLAIQIKQAFEDPAPSAPLVDPSAQRLVSQLNPALSMPSQALAVAPATTDPAGDDAAKDKWLIDGGKNAKGTVIYYEPTLSLAKKDLLDHPGYAQLLDPSGETVLDPERIAAMRDSDPLFDDYKALKWRETAEAGAKAGKTVYRYSQAPYLQGDGAAGTLKTLGLKAIGSIEPGMAAVTSFLGGVDNAASFGAGDRVARALPNPAAPPAGAPNDPLLESMKGSPDEPVTTVTGGTSGASNYGDLASQAAEEHPAARYLGQGLGALNSWAPSNMLFAKATGIGARGAAALGNGALARMGGAMLGAGAAGVADQGIREGVNAGADLAEHGETPITMGSAVSNMGSTGLMTGALGGGVEMLGAGLGKTADAIAEGHRYGGAPGRLERAGYKFRVIGGGPALSPETQSLIKVARMTGAGPVDMIAKEISPAVAKAADEEVKGAIDNVTTRKEAFYQTPPGKQEIPSKNFLDEGLRILRSKHDRAGGELRPLDVSPAIGAVHKVWNNEILRVSTEPVEGAVALSPDEAELFLSKARQEDLKPKADSDSAELFRKRYRTDAPATASDGLAADLRRRGIDKVYAVPRVHDARSADEALHSLDVFGGEKGDLKGTEEYQRLDKAMRADRDVRPGANGPGGWSEMQAQHSQLIDDAKKLERLAAPKGEAFRPLVSYGTPKQGELLSVEALRSAADKGGVREQLEHIRHLNEAQQLRSAANYGPPMNGGARMGLASPGAHLDAATLRAFPVLRRLSGPSSEIYGPTSPLGAPGLLRRGMAGTLLAPTSDEHSKD